MTMDEVIKRLESEYHLDEDHGWKVLLKRLERCEAFSKRYANHDRSCRAHKTALLKCDCGYDAARAAVEGK